MMHRKGRGFMEIWVDADACPVEAKRSPVQGFQTPADSYDAGR